MHLQLSRLILSLAALSFVAAYTERYKVLRTVLEYEYRPKYRFSHVKYLDFFGRGIIDDWDSIVITYIDEEYRDFMKKEMESETAPFNMMKYLLSRELKVGDTLGKGVGEVEEYRKKMIESRLDDPSDTLGRVRILVKFREMALNQLLKGLHEAVQPIRNVILWGMAISRNAGIIYKGATYTISLNGSAWRVATLPTAYGKDYDTITALNLNESIGFCIDSEWEKLRRENSQTIGWKCATDHNDNWQPAIYFSLEEETLLVWNYIASRIFYD
ncbi:hypothetical protein CLIB1423_18S00782 [[Candida] railenensis]|uniref:Uncharacterized protein n=1 Tax=[Candida] railenensis TaxID=45579 RepID=A0A9P0QTJ7_9ASCO|nr:hypothetical protein CLIB1423_18S00782 [[Candida] railenensis]